MTRRRSSKPRPAADSCPSGRKRAGASLKPSASAAKLGSAHRHIVRLHDISKVLARFETIRRTFPSLVELLSEALHVPVAVLIEARQGRPRTFVWHAPGVPPEHLQQVKNLARGSHRYFVGGERGTEETVSLDTIDEGRPGARAHDMNLPLVVERRPIFGVLCVRCRGAVTDVDLAFLNAVANLVALALDSYYARRREIALRKRAQSLARTTEESLLREQAARAAAQESVLREKAALALAKEAVAARDAFISVASHELRNPLGVILLQLGLIHRGVGSGADPRVLSRLASAKLQVGRMKRLVDNLLDVSRITAGRLDLEVEDVDLAVVAREVVARSEDEARQAGCALVLRADAPVVGRWDRMRLDQVITNLLSNALKYGRGKPVEASVESDGRASRLVVRDHGIGISPGDQTRIFERFERAAGDRQFVGFGLGLWIVRQIVEAMGGRIRVTSEKGVGSTFTVELPLVPRTAARAA